MAGVKTLRRMDTTGNPDDFALPKARYGFGISWDAPPGRKKVDVDLQCVVVDSAGAIIDCAYYNNMKAVRAITHSGDEVTGEADGIDEQVWVNIHRLPANVSVLVFVVAAYAGGQLKDVVNGTLHVLEESQRNEIAHFEMERSAASVDVVSVMFRDAAGGWTLRIIEEPAQQGQHFMDILPLISEVVRIFIPNAPKKQKVAFAMEKGGVMDMPQTLDAITIGLGWDVAAVGDGEVDLDVSAVLVSPDGKEVEAVFFGRPESLEHGVRHSGDNLSGEGEGDDEQIVVHLGAVGAAVQQVVFVINIYSASVTFQNVTNPFCRVVDEASQMELCRYNLRDVGHLNGLVVAKLAREAGGRWGFHALGLPCTGRTYKDSLPKILSVCQSDTRALMVRGGTTVSLGGGGEDAAAGPSVPVSSMPIDFGNRAAGICKPKKDCVVQ